MRRKIIAGNWKMNGDIAFTRDYLNEFSQALVNKNLVGANNLQIILAPPSILLSEMKQCIADGEIDVAAQNVSAYEQGAYTGEVSASMLADLACEWCLVGHSERRALFGESDEVVVAKIGQLLTKGLNPILCVGETLEQRELGLADSVVAGQLDAVFSAFSEEELLKIVVAYEPVWAIGTGKTATPEQAQEMHESIRNKVAKKSASLAQSLVILYGGSVSSSNAKALFAQKDIDGGLVGGASLKVDEFVLVCEQLGCE